MEELKSLFGESSLSYEEFEKRLTENESTIKLANLKSGNYVGKEKYEESKNNANSWKEKYEKLSAGATDYDTLKADYETLKSEAETLRAEKDLREKMSEIKGADVKDEFAEFVYSKVINQVNDDKDFKNALKEYLKDHEQYLNKKGTYANLQYGTATPKSDNEKMNAIIRGYR